MQNKIVRFFAGIIFLFLLVIAVVQWTQRQDHTAETIDVGPVSSTRVVSPPPRPTTTNTAQKLPPITRIVEIEPLAVGLVKQIQVNLYHDEGKRQQYYALENDQLFMSGPVSGAATDEDMPTGVHPDTPHNHLGAFFVIKRLEHHTSSIYNTPMDFCMFYHGGHAIHACLPEEIIQLGLPASHGCIRVSPTDAEILFNWVGNDPVRIIVIRSEHF